MASYAAAVDIFRSSAAAAAAGGGGLEGVAAEDMAAMQALLEEDENSPDAFAMAEDESLDYDVRVLTRSGKNRLPLLCCFTEDLYFWGGRIFFFECACV